MRECLFASLTSNKIYDIHLKYITNWRNNMSVENNNNENGQQQSVKTLLKKIKKAIDSFDSFNSSVISTLGLSIVGIIDWIFKLVYSQNLESFYKIDEKYFFSYNYRKTFYILLLWILISSSYFFISEIYIKKNRNEKNG